jgi:peptidylprolyl isomerase
LIGGECILPKSRKRKIKRGGTSSRASYAPRGKSRKTKFIVIAIIAALAIATGVFLLAGSSGPNQPPASSGPVGVEVTTPSGLKYVDEKIGDGPSPQRGQQVTVHYTGKLENGTRFDSSRDKGQPMTYRIGITPMVPGWAEGIMTMKVGGKRKLILPPQLGYGAAGEPRAGIPPNATILFDIELLDIK